MTPSGLRRALPPMRLRSLVIGTSVMSVGLVTAVLGWAAYGIASRSLEEVLIDLVTARSAAAANALDSSFRTIQTVPVSNARVVEVLPTWEPGFIPRFLQASAQDHPDILGVSIALEPGIVPGHRTFMPYVYQLTPGSTTAYGLEWIQDYRDPSKQQPGGPNSWYREGMEHPDAVTWSLPYDYPLVLKGGKRTMVVMVTVETTIRRQGRVAGLATADVALDRLTRVASDVRLGKRGYAILVDRFGHVLSHPDPHRRFEPGSRLEDVRLDQPQYGALAGWADRLLAPNWGAGPGIVPGHVEGRVFRFRDAGRPQLAAATLIPSTGWRLIVVGDEEELFASLDWLRTASLGLSLLGTVGIGALLWAVLALTLRPLQSLARGCELVSTGRPHEAQAALQSAGLLFNTYEIAHMRQAIEKVTNYIAVTAELERSNMELREGERIRDQILSQVSHDLQTPIMVIQSLGSSLSEGEYGPLEPGAREAAQQIQTSAATLSRLVNDLLDLSRIKAGRLELDLRPVDLAELVGLVVAEIRPLAAEKQQTVSVSVESELPNVRADEQRLAQVLSNLLSNAIKYTQAGGHIAVRLRAAGAEAVCEVEDDGVGIAAEDLPKVFQAFSRVGDRRAQRGTGLGLSISAALVEAHGGRIQVRSQPGKGSVFWFTLPVAGQG